MSKTSVIALEQTINLQTQVVRKLNREAASFLAVRAMAREIIEVSSGSPTQARMDEISKLAEALQYTIEDASARMNTFVTNIHDMDIER